MIKINKIVAFAISHTFFEMFSRWSYNYEFFTQQMFINFNVKTLKLNFYAEHLRKSHISCILSCYISPITYGIFTTEVLIFELVSNSNEMYNSNCVKNENAVISSAFHCKLFLQLHFLMSLPNYEESDVLRPYLNLIILRQTRFVLAKSIISCYWGGIGIWYEPADMYTYLCLIRRTTN